ncbi:MAG: tetratricopeptide repeat protein [Cytophagales bacterium]|nr:tetratricopeptide repeat protein [Cytophagales bacterium]
MRRGTLVLLVFLLAHGVACAQETLAQGLRNQRFQAGLDFLAHRQFAAALNAFDDFLRVPASVDTRNVEAGYYRAYCAITLFHSDGEKLLERFVEEHPNHPRAILAYYDLAGFFYGEKAYGKAAGYFTKVNFSLLTQEQQNIGRFRWGYCLFSQRNFLPALDQFNTVKSLGGQYGPASSYYAGFIETSLGDYDNALKDLQRAAAHESYSTIVPVLIATVYFKQGKDDELLAYAEQALLQDGVASADELSLMIAEAWFRKGDYKKALERYQDYLDDHKNASRQIVYRAGFAAAQASENELAISLLKRAASDADSVGVYASYLLGSLYLKRQDKALALTAFETARKFKKDARLAEESLFMTAKINYELGRSETAISEFEAVLEEYPQSSHQQEIKELLSQAYVNANNYNKAIEYIESLPRRSPAVDRAYQKATFLKGTELFNKEDYAHAVVYFDKSLEYPLDARLVGEASYWLGETYSIGRKYEQSTPAYERALGNIPEKSNLIRNVRYGLGYSHYNMRQYDKARISFKDYTSRAVPSDPNFADGFLRLADCQYILKEYNEALASYRKVVQLKSVDSDYARLQAGTILAIQRRYGEAVAELEGVAKNGSSRYAEDALFQLGQMDFERSNYPEAIRHFTALINTAKTSRYIPYALSRRAAAQYNLKDYNKTANDYIQVIEKFPGHAVTQDLLLPLQESLSLAGRGAEFDQYLSHFKNANPQAAGIEGVEFESSKSLYFSQNYPKAVELLSRFVTNYPESAHRSEAQYYQAESYYRMKDFSKCLELNMEIRQDDTFPLRSKVIARIAELQFRKQEFEKAIESFRQLIRLSTNKKDEYTAYSGLMESFYLLANYDSADFYARKIQQQGNVNVSAQRKASLYLGKSAKARGNYEAAKDEFLTTLNAAQDEYGAEAKYLLAEIFFLNKEHKQCHETLLSLNSDFSGYEEWVGRSFLLLADNYAATGEIFQAKGTLKSLIENFPGQVVRDMATEKLKAIEKEESKKAVLQPNDSTDNPK